MLLLLARVIVCFLVALMVLVVLAHIVSLIGATDVDQDPKGDKGNVFGDRLIDPLDSPSVLWRTAHVGAYPDIRGLPTAQVTHRARPKANRVKICKDMTHSAPFIAKLASTRATRTRSPTIRQG